MDNRELVKHEKSGPVPADGQFVWIPPGYELATGQNGREHEPESHLWDYLWLIWRWRWLVSLVFLLCVSLATFIAVRSVSIYMAAAKLRIEPETPKILQFQGEQVAVTSSRTADFFATQLQMIQSRQLAERVIKRLGLFGAGTPQAAPAAVEPAPDPKTSGWQTYFQKIPLYVASFFKSNPNAIPNPNVDPDELATQMRVNAFLAGLKVSQVPETEIIQLAYMSPDPNFCATVANAIGEEYIRNTYDSRYESYDYARTWLKENLDELKAKLEQSDEELTKLTVGGDYLLSSESSQQYTQQLEAIRQKLVEAERLIFDKEFELKRFGADTNFAALQSLGDTRLQKLVQDYSDREISYEKMKTKMGPKMDDMRELEAEMKGIRGQLTDAVRQAKNKIELDLKQTLENRDYLQKQYNTERERVAGLQKGMIKFNILKREVDVNRELYNNLLQRWKEVGIASGVKARNVSFVEKAVVPLAPILPNKPRTILLGAFLGLFLGIGLVFFLEYMDTSIKSSEELERIAHLSTLGVVPHFDGRNGSKKRVPVELVVNQKPRSVFAESVRGLRTAIQYSFSGRPPKTILVTSCLPAEGKTTVATNLAIAFAQRNKTVLLVDADLKKPSLHKLFNLERCMGLTELLTGKFDGVNIPETNIGNLFVLTSGQHTPNPVELMDSDIMRDFLEKASREYDHIILDSPPALNLADTGVLAPYVDGVILVVQPGRTPKEAVRRVRDKIFDIQGRILGVIMNNPKQKVGNRYVSRYDYGYHYGYGRNYGEDADQRPHPREEALDVAFSSIELVDASSEQQKNNKQYR